MASICASWTSPTGAAGLPSWPRTSCCSAAACCDNIRYAHPAADEASVRHAVQLAHLDDLVARLPQGLDTAVGERGARLSGGEKQRIAIARALLQHPLLIVFDEATSAVDSDAERLVMNELDRLFPSTTRLIISHRERPLENADLLLEMRDGVLRQIAP